MIFLESFSGGILAGTIGVLTGLLLVYILPYMIKSMNFTIPITISPDLIIGSVLSAIIIMITASVGPALKVSKLNIVETIK
jgi:putative ABC transport system permease protein